MVTYGYGQWVLYVHTHTYTHEHLVLACSLSRLCADRRATLKLPMIIEMHQKNTNQCLNLRHWYLPKHWKAFFSVELKNNFVCWWFNQFKVRFFFVLSKFLESFEFSLSRILINFLLFELIHFIFMMKFVFVVEAAENLTYWFVQRNLKGKSGVIWSGKSIPKGVTEMHWTGLRIGAVGIWKNNVDVQNNSDSYFWRQFLLQKRNLFKMKILSEYLGQ